MSIELATTYQPYTDELFTIESKKQIITNDGFDWTGSHTIKVYRVSTSNMNDYDREGTGSTLSRYGAIERLGATTQSMTLRKDRSFTFAIDRLDADETKQQLAAASALARQLREVVIPEVDTWVLNEMCDNAGTTAAPSALTVDNIFNLIIDAGTIMDDNFVPENNRFLVVTPKVYQLLKQSNDVIMITDTSDQKRIRGVVGNLDGLEIIRVPENRLPAAFGFMIVHPIATVAPVKLESYIVHENPPFINGSLVEGRINYDAFILDNKAKAVYYQPQS
jgi:hypothetical protein